MAIRILFVCLGNICRSPAAEGVFRRLADEAGLTDSFEIDSAGTGSWHIGDTADRRMRAAARRRGIELTSLARQVTREDFNRFDWILAMDASNLHHLQAMAPRGARAQVRLFRDFDPEAPGTDVPDPYFGEADGFDEVLDIVTRTARALLDDIVPEGRRP